MALVDTHYHHPKTGSVAGEAIGIFIGVIVILGLFFWADKYASQYNIRPGDRLPVTTSAGTNTALTAIPPPSTASRLLTGASKLMSAAGLYR